MLPSIDNRQEHIAVFILWILISVISFISLRKSKVPTISAILAAVSGVTIGVLMLLSDSR